MSSSAGSQPKAASRMTLYIRSIASGYLVMAVNVVYSLVSIPLVLHYLPQREFGLWALMAQITGYLALLDFGMTPSTARLLIEVKDRKTESIYAELVSAGFLVGLAQGVLIVIFGQLIPLILLPVLNVPSDLAATFGFMLRVQSVITGVGFALRTASHLLVAHQRNDLLNYNQMAILVINLTTLALSLRAGAGVYSVLWSNAAALVVGLSMNIFWCVRLNLFPAGRRWVRIRFSQFKELFVYGSDIFLVHLGSQLIMASQSIVLSRSQSLVAVATWAVGTKAFLLMSNVLFQLYDYSVPGLSEMMVKQEWRKLRGRYSGIVSLSMSLTAVAAVCFAACNTSFIQVWTGTRIEWKTSYDLMLALWLFLLIWVHCHCGFVLITKQVGFMRYIFFLEGVVFVSMGLIAARIAGISGMIAVSCCVALAFSGWYGTWRVGKYLEIPLAETMRTWFTPSLKTLLVLVPLAVAISWGTRSLPGAQQLTIRAAILAPLGLMIFLRLGIPAQLRAEFQSRLPAALRPWLSRLQGAPPAPTNPLPPSPV